MGVVSAAKAFTEVVSTAVDSGSTGDSDAGSDFMVATPTFMAGIGMAAARITMAPTNAIERHGPLLQWRGRSDARHLPDRPKHPPEHTKVNMTRIDRILVAVSLVTANLPTGITYAMLLAR